MRGRLYDASERIHSLDHWKCTGHQLSQSDLGRLPLTSSSMLQYSTTSFLVMEYLKVLMKGCIWLSWSFIKNRHSFTVKFTMGAMHRIWKISKERNVKVSALIVLLSRLILHECDALSVGMTEVLSCNFQSLRTFQTCHILASLVCGVGKRRKSSFVDRNLRSLSIQS